MHRLILRQALIVTCAALLLTLAAAPVLAQFFQVDRVRAGDTDSWSVRAPAGQTRVTVDGDGDTDLDCWVYDRYGNLLGEDTDSTDLCLIRFRNPSSGVLTIRITNLGEVYNRYELSVD